MAPDQAEDSQPPQTAPSAATQRDASETAQSPAADPRSAYDDLRRLIPTLADELELLRASLTEHNLWLRRDDHGANPPSSVQSNVPPAQAPSSTPAGSASLSVSGSPSDPPGYSAAISPRRPDAPPRPISTVASEVGASSDLPSYSASDVPPYRGRREEVAERRDQLMEWLKEGEDVLREYSARYAQLAEELSLPAEDLLGTWREAAADNALPDYEVIAAREDLMVGGVGEVPPSYASRS